MSRRNSKANTAARPRLATAYPTRQLIKLRSYADCYFVEDVRELIRRNEVVER